MLLSLTNWQLYLVPRAVALLTPSPDSEFFVLRVCLEKQFLGFMLKGGMLKGPSVLITSVLIGPSIHIYTS